MEQEKVKVKAELKRGGYMESAVKALLEITFPNGRKHTIFRENLTVDEMEILSPYERKKVLADCEKQIDEMPVGGCPTAFRKMLAQLRKY